MDIITAIFAVFTAIGNWISSSVTALMPIFYTETAGLTLLGSLAVCSLGLGVIFLILGFITNFFQWRS